jgi:hypothetical protein
VSRERLCFCFGAPKSSEGLALVQILSHETGTQPAALPAPVTAPAGAASTATAEPTAGVDDEWADDFVFTGWRLYKLVGRLHRKLSLWIAIFSLVLFSSRAEAPPPLDAPTPEPFVPSQAPPALTAATAAPAAVETHAASTEGTVTGQDDDDWGDDLAFECT